MINPSQHKPEGMASPPKPDPEHNARLAWIKKARGLHRNKRMIGFAGIILGAGLVLWARQAPDQAPAWALTSGFVVLGVSWLLHPCDRRPLALGEEKIRMAGPAPLDK
jgi:hypothetical protein